MARSSWNGAVQRDGGGRGVGGGAGGLWRGSVGRGGAPQKRWARGRCGEDPLEGRAHDAHGVGAVLAVVGAGQLEVAGTHTGLPGAFGGVLEMGLEVLAAGDDRDGEGAGEARRGVLARA